MKKVWALEKKTTQKDIDSIRTLTQTLIDDGNIPEDVAQRVIDSLNARKVGDWVPDYVSNNYHKFCSEVKYKLNLEDSKAIRELKKELGKVSFSSDINAKFRETHLSVFNSYRVVEGEIEDLEVNYYNYKFVKENEGVYKYLWSTKF